MDKVKVILTNRHAKFLKPYPIEEFRKILRYRAPGYYFSPYYRMKRWDGYISLIKHSKVGTGLFLSFRKELEEAAEIKFKIVDKRDPPKFNNDNLESDRDYQNESVTAMQNCNHGGLILKATGSGKTFEAGLFFRRLIGNGCFVVDELTLMDQAKKELQRVIEEKIGIVGNGIFNPRRITVATVQTLHKHRYKKEFQEWNQSLEAMIIDEIHTQINKRNIDTVSKMSPKMVIGLTATLELKKKPVKMRVFALAGSPIYEYPLEQGVKEGYLSSGVVASIGINQRNLWEQDYQTEYTEMIVRSRPRNKAITALARECLDRGRSVVIIVERVKHLKRLSRMLEDIPHRTVYGARKVVDRIKAKDDFDKKKIRLLIVNKVFKKGISINAIDTIIECAGLKSKNDVIQKYGRGIRLSKDKDGLLYFDMSDYGVENRFRKGTSSRLRALKAREIPIKKFEWDNNAEEIVEETLKLLNRTIKKLKKAS